MITYYEKTRQRLERGEIKLDLDFFQGFTADLQNKNAWKEFHTNFQNAKKKLKDTANPTQLGDHISLKAETADYAPTINDRRAQSPPSQDTGFPSNQAQKEERPSLSKLAKDTTIGDPASLESEDVVEPSSKTTLNTQPSSRSNHSPSHYALPSLPQIDSESLFWTMMSASRSPDPYIFPALQKLSKQEPRPILAALSNTVIFPPDHPWSKELHSASSSDPKAFVFNPTSYFDVYVASAEVGMRKPNRDIYELTIQRLDEFDKRQRGGSGIEPKDIIFLDDIGENLKTGKLLGMKTIRVQLGKTWRAVKELEDELNGTELMDERTRRSKL